MVSLRLEQPSVSKHLRVLHDVGLVRVRRSGAPHAVSNKRRSDSAAPRMDENVRTLLGPSIESHQGTRRGKEQAGDKGRSELT